MNVETEEDRRGKRRREDQDEPQRHEVLWFTDGNVVLATDKYLFKVFKGILSMLSAVFRDMFELGESSGGESVVQEMYEGVPLVTLVDDQGEDVAHLLRALYDHRYYNCYNDKTPLNVVIALLDLSVKYEFKDLMKDVVKQISRQFPMSLRDMDRIICEEEPLFQRIDQEKAGLLLLQAAYKTGIDALLPILFFFCSNMHVDKIFQTAQSMDLESLRILIKGRDELIFASCKLVSNLPQDLKADIKNSECLKDGLCVNESRYLHLDELNTPYFHYTQGKETVKFYLSFACKNCASSVAKSIEKRRGDIWAKIPSYFGYPGWEEANAKLEELMDS
ncbi:hypothetical protein SCHPADRAFT_946356 [Schizopora paradoxa]|uniref:BTB domain-containing protein n=1 Tax=Schizopora paradoxa TaxID=27342 RepID=A0A0H2R2T3_9AGAM|nr:hypothetical protein SCHPADRAFT_946356 [Schizopora paradoxa]